MTFIKMWKFRSTYFVTQEWLLAVTVKIVNTGGGMAQQKHNNGFLCKFLFA